MPGGLCPLSGLVHEPAGVEGGFGGGFMVVLNRSSVGDEDTLPCHAMPLQLQIWILIGVSQAHREASGRHDSPLQHL